MRLPLVISTGLLISLGLNAPVFFQPPLKLAQAQAIATESSLGKLIQNRSLWRNQNISNYKFTLTRGCFCLPEARGPVVIEVRNGVAVSIISVSTGQPVDPQLFEQYDTVPKLFKVIRDAIARRASSLHVEYDPQLGYPTQINIDYSSLIADEELFLTVENLQVIP